MDLKILRRAIMVGVIFELMLVAMGHYRPRFRPTFERILEGTVLANIVPKDALEREVESILDLPVASAGTVDGLLTIDPVPRKYQHAADGVAECSERFVFFLAEQPRDALQCRPPRISVSDRVAGQEILTKFGAMI